MADDDNFDIDIYGDETSPDYQDTSLQGEVKQEDTTPMHTDSHTDGHNDGKTSSANAGIKEENYGEEANGRSHQENGTQQISSTGGSNDQVQPPKQAPQQQGMKRKQGDVDDRPTDPGATSALMINDLNWWISEEDIRGWANQSGCEDELIDVTFNEHKVNGKSKGQVYVHMQSPQAATSLKHQLENFYKDQTHAKKPSAIFNPPHVNPFKTLPKDVPARDKNRGDRSTTSNFGGSQNSGGGNFNNRFTSNNRGNFNSNRGNQNMNFQNRNFSNPAAGNMGFSGPGGMNNFQGNNMGGMNNFSGGGFNRGGMMGGMRGGMNNRGRGGMMNGMGNMGNNMGMNMPMGGNMMGMSGGMMGMGGNMGGNMGMMGGMGAGNFGGNQTHFNPAFFNQNQGGGGDGNWNPHPAKRPRPE
ncbi:hypothetical protein B0J11DRAFT_505666 [Dendryphion nanum]|uniref:Uncharacterized protein n=1 Tax=Dendryphion nanum TaxID=256645 RepID=A0A9P9DYT9_9PLEO|nr:hypothetical protein B0J11DRAFT_505666 [Dendryphion nanum]